MSLVIFSFICWDIQSSSFGNLPTSSRLLFKLHIAYEIIMVMIKMSFLLHHLGIFFLFKPLKGNLTLWVCSAQWTSSLLSQELIVFCDWHCVIRHFLFCGGQVGGGGLLEGHPMAKHNRPSSLVNIIILNNRVRVGVLKYLPGFILEKKKSIRNYAAWTY